MEEYQLLEGEIAEWAGYAPENVVVCSSGTAALHLALEAFQLPQGSEVLVPDFTMIACARAVSLAGLTPVFVDCNEKLLIDHWSTYEGIREGAKVIMAVHIYGRRCDMNWLTNWDNILFIEDLAEAHGIRPHADTHAACWSFYKNKIIAGEEGGAVAFKDLKHANPARQLRSLGFTEAHDFTHIPRGCNYRLSNANAKLISRSLAEYQNVDLYLGREKGWGGTERMRREIEGWYDTACPDEWRMPPRDAPWVYDLRIPGLDRYRMGKIVGELNEEGIAARHGFKCCSLQEEYIVYRPLPKNPNAVKASNEVFYLPIRPGRTTAEDVQRSFEIIRRTLAEA